MGNLYKWFSPPSPDVEREKPVVGIISPIFYSRTREGNASLCSFGPTLAARSRQRSGMVVTLYILQSRHSMSSIGTIRISYTLDVRPRVSHLVQVGVVWSHRILEMRQGSQDVGFPFFLNILSRRLLSSSIGQRNSEHGHIICRTTHIENAKDALPRPEVAV